MIAPAPWDPRDLARGRVPCLPRRRAGSYNRIGMRYCPTCGTRFSNEVAFCPHDGGVTQELADAGPQKDPLVGRVIDGRYRVEEPLGEGGMGIVYLATHAVLGKKFAVKVLRGDMAKDPDVVQRFIQEAQAATSIGHENIIDISDFGRLPDGAVYFVMEHLQGEALTALIARGGSIPMMDAMQIIRQIASALAAAHQRGIVHRDLKPDNVFLIRRGEHPHFVKVLDFGIAKVGGAASALTRTGMVFGTPHYMSPEQAAGQSVDRRTDIYALGVIMYEMFTGKVPFDAETFMGILSKHMFEPPIPPSQLDKSIRLGALEDVLMKALSKKPETRYQTMEELVADLDAVSAGGTVEIGRKPGITPPDNLADALEPPSRTEMRLSKVNLPSSKAPLVVLGLVGLLVVAAAVGGALYAFSGDDDGSAQLRPEPPVVPDPIPPVGAAPDAAALARAPDASAADGLVHIVSLPAGAQVLVAGAIIGNTPARLPIPESGEQREVEVRMVGFETQVLRLTSESPSSVEVELVPSVERPVRGPRGTTGGTAPIMDTVAVQTPPSMVETHPPTMMSSSHSEVIDPWN